MGQKDPLSDVRAVFEKLNLWKNESQRQLSDIIDTQNNSITEGINELVKRVSTLEGELSDVTQERTVLQQTVANLNGEISVLNEKLTEATTLLESGRVDAGSDINDAITLEDLDTYTDHADTGDMCLDETDMNITKPSEDPSNENIYIIETPLNGLAENNLGHANNRSDKKKTEQRKRALPHAVCLECKISFSTDEDLQSHLEKFHSSCSEKTEATTSNKKLQNDDINLKIKESTQRKVYTNSNLTHPRSTPSARVHVRKQALQEKAGSYACDGCGYVTSSKVDLNNHWALFHNTGTRRLKCEQCSYETVDASNRSLAQLSRHIGYSHNAHLKIAK